MKRYLCSVNLALLLLVFLSACGRSATPVPIAPIAGLPTGADGYPWWNDTVFYEIFVRSFYDSNGDGIGDLNGVIAKLDYLNDGDPATTTDLGVTGIWLMPIHPAVHYHGYDVTDYYDVNPDYGTKDDFKRLVDEAHKRGIRVIIDFVMNHTSDQHPWFIQSKDRNSKYRDWYVWSDAEPRGGGWRQAADGYYYGIFEEYMPDLNYRSPDVSAEMETVARFWLQDMGVDGFRVDAAKHLVEEGAVTSNSDSTHVWFKLFRTFYKGVDPEAVTVGEMFGDPSPVAAKYTQGDELDLGFDFALAQAFIVSARTGKADGVIQTMSVDLKIFKPGQFATFLSNHDQSRAMSQLAANTDKAKAAAALLLTAPGVPFIYYGEEIGMTGVKREGDQEVRTPMQWSGEDNGGFTTGMPWFPVNADYAERKNVADESGDANSVLSSYRTLIRLRNDHAALRVGDSIIVDSGNDAVFAQLRVSKNEVVLVVVNLSGEEVSEFALTLASGPLSGIYGAASMLGKGGPSNPVVNAQGGFDDYKPVSSLPAFGSLIIQLQPQK